MVERGKERRSMLPSDLNTITPADIVAQQSPTTELRLANQTDRSTRIWMGESMEDESNITTTNVSNTKEVVYAQPEKKSVKKSSESKSSSHSVEKHTLDSPVNKEPSVKPNANESMNEGLEKTGNKKKDEVVYAMPEKKTSIRKVTTDDGNQEHEVKGHGEDSNPRQTSRENSEMTCDESGASLKEEATNLPRKATDNGVVYALPMKKSGSIKVSDGGEDDYASLRDETSSHPDYASLRDDTSPDKPKEVISAAPRVSTGYEDLVIGDSPPSVPDNVPDLAPGVKLKSMSLPTAKEMPRKLADKTKGSGEYHKHDAKGHPYAQSMKKFPGVNALNTSSFDDSMTPISPTSSERLKLVRSVILDPWSEMSESDTENLHSKKKSSKKDSGYEEINLGEITPPFAHDMPRIPPDAVEKLRKQNEKDSQNTDGTKGEVYHHEFGNLDDLHQIADDGSIYTIPMKKVPSKKRSVKEPVSLELEPESQTGKSSVEKKWDYEDVDLGDIKPPSPNEIASDTPKTNGRESSDPAYAISPVVSPPEITSKADQRPVEQKGNVPKETVSNAEKKKPTPRTRSSLKKRGSEEEAVVVLGTPGKQRPSLRESGKPLSTVIIPDQPDVHNKDGATDTMSSGVSTKSSVHHNDDSSTTTTSGENECDDPAYAVSMLTTPQSPSSGHRNNKNKGPPRPPPPSTTNKTRKGSLETTQTPSGHPLVRNRAYREDKEEVMVELGTPGVKNPSIRTPEGRVTPIDISKKSTGK